MSVAINDSDGVDKETYEGEFRSSDSRDSIPQTYRSILDCAICTT